METNSVRPSENEPPEVLWKLGVHITVSGVIDLERDLESPGGMLLAQYKTKKSLFFSFQSKVESRPHGLVLRPIE